MTSPGDPSEPYRSAFSGLSDEELTTAHERAAADPDSPSAPILLAEMIHRGLADPEWGMTAAPASEDQWRWAEALVNEKSHGASAAVFVAKRIGETALAA